MKKLVENYGFSFEKAELCLPVLIEYEVKYLFELLFSSWIKVLRNVSLPLYQANA